MFFQLVLSHILWQAIDERLFERVMQKFTVTATRRCGIKDGLRSNGDWAMECCGDAVGGSFGKVC